MLVVRSCDTVAPKHFNHLPEVIVGKIVFSPFINSHENKEQLTGFTSCVGPFCQCRNKTGLSSLAMAMCVFLKQLRGIVASSFFS